MGELNPLDYPFRIPETDYLWQVGRELAIDRWRQDVQNLLKPPGPQTG